MFCYIFVFLAFGSNVVLLVVDGKIEKKDWGGGVWGGDGGGLFN